MRCALSDGSLTRSLMMLLAMLADPLLSFGEDWPDSIKGFTLSYSMGGFRKDLLRDASEDLRLLMDREMDF
jgi:hypothetical protein